MFQIILCYDFSGFGKFHYWLLLVCGWANASDAVEILCISFLLPSAECDLKLTTSDKGWLSATLFIGKVIFYNFILQYDIKYQITLLI